MPWRSRRRFHAALRLVLLLVAWVLALFVLCRYGSASPALLRVVPDMAGQALAGSAPGERAEAGGLAVARVPLLSPPHGVGACLAPVGAGRDSFSVGCDEGANLTACLCSVIDVGIGVRDTLNDRSDVGDLVSEKLDFLDCIEQSNAGRLEHVGGLCVVERCGEAVGLQGLPAFVGGQSDPSVSLGTPSVELCGCGVSIRMGHGGKPLVAFRTSLETVVDIALECDHARCERQTDGSGVAEGIDHGVTGYAPEQAPLSLPFGAEPLDFGEHDSQCAAEWSGQVLGVRFPARDVGGGWAGKLGAFAIRVADGQELVDAATEHSEQRFQYTDFDLECCESIRELAVRCGGRRGLVYLWTCVRGCKRSVLGFACVGLDCFAVSASVVDPDACRTVVGWCWIGHGLASFFHAGEVEGSAIEARACGGPEHLWGVVGQRAVADVAFEHANARAFGAQTRGAKFGNSRQATLEGVELGTEQVDFIEQHAGVDVVLRLSRVEVRSELSPAREGRVVEWVIWGEQSAKYAAGHGLQPSGHDHVQRPRSPRAKAVAG